jgi:acetylornithine deacetylase/succinyl-diaminopimelate desuccinylase-like protein
MRVLLALLFAIAAQSPHQQFARDVLRELVEINTSDKFGTQAAAEAVAARLRREGFGADDVHVVGPRPHRSNVVARLRGSGTARPVLFLAHLDVVDARKEDWSDGLDPFTLTERDGFLYGRGTTDIKQEVAVLVTTLVRLKQERFVPSRDIIVALTADEEVGGTDGIGWLLRDRRPLIDAACAINTDAGGGQIEKEKRFRYTVQTSEKASVTFRLETTDRGGHSSQPTKENAIYRLAEALTRVGRLEFPVKLNETTRTFLDRMAVHETGSLAADLKGVANKPPDLNAASRLAAASPFYNSVMRTTCVATMLEGGHAVNALPQTARASVNCRILPEDSLEAVMSALTSAVADRRIAITPVNELRASPASPLVPEVLTPIERLVAEMWPGVPVVPVMDPWATDGLHLRRAGIPVYGVPSVFTEIDPVRSHGRDERVGVEAFYEGLEFMYRLMKALTAG